MSESRCTKVDRMIRRAVEDALNEWATSSNTEVAPLVRSNRSYLAISVSSRITSDPYRMKELADIMAWKKAPRC